MSQGSKKTILLVEDDLIFSDLLERKLKQEGYTVFRSTNVLHAREIMNENTIDGICLDIILPGIDGFTFLRELKANETFKSIPILIFSNFGDQEEIDSGLKLGATGYIIKTTMGPQEIADKIKALISK